MVIESVPEYDRRNDVKKCRSGYQSTIRKGIRSLLGHRKRHLQIVKNRPMTRRGDIINHKFHFWPLGFVATHSLGGKRILQLFAKMKLAGMKLHLMTSLGNGNFRVKPCSLENYKISRCHKPSGFGKVKQILLHYFSDASEKGYG